MKRKIMLIISFFFLLHQLDHSFLVKAKTFEDPYFPISFRIQVLPWENVDEIIPVGAKFTIFDVETGLHFRVQRRAGRNHADVQPLTAKDTKIMKTIYGGRWSWKRKPILVLAGDLFIAASMNGMPHGAGALKNNFRGHFCVHFYGSLTHKRKAEDLAHKLMILKAAGKLEKYLQEANPHEVLQILAVAVRQQDPLLMDWVFDDTGCKDCVVSALLNLSSMKIEPKGNKEEFEKNGHFIVEMPAIVHYHSENGQGKRTMTFILHKQSIVDPWKISLQNFEVHSIF